MVVPPPLPLAADMLTCRVVPPMTVAVASFSGYAVPDVVLSVRDKLARDLRAAGVELSGAGEQGDLLLAQYNELFSLPWQRDNEVWLRVDLDG